MNERVVESSIQQLVEIDRKLDYTLNKPHYFSTGWGQNVSDVFDPHTVDVCLYHAGCPDGIGGAYPFWRHNQSLPDIKLVIQGFVPTHNIMI